MNCLAAKNNILLTISPHAASTPMARHRGMRRRPSVNAIRWRLGTDAKNWDGVCRTASEAAWRAGRAAGRTCFLGFAPISPPRRRS